MANTEFTTRSLPLGEVSIPDPGNVDLWFLDLRALGSPVGTAADEELSGPQLRSTRRFYLRLLLGAYLGLPGKDVKISRLVKGKPVLDLNAHGNVLDFSSAASDGCCLIGVTSGGLLGVDLEVVHRTTLKPRSLVRRYFSQREQKLFGQVPDERLHRQFIHTWAYKEAVVKAAGHGIANQLSRFSVHIDPDTPPEVTQMEGGGEQDWRLGMVYPNARFLAAVALKNSAMHLRAYTLTRPGS